MAPQLSTKQLSPDPSEPRIHHMERGPDGLAGWKVYDDNKASWVDAWAHYYDEKSMKSKSSWAQYEREKHDIAQRRSRSGSDATRAPSPYKSAPAATKISFSLSIDTDISTAPTRSWKPEVRTMPRRRATMPIPSLDRSATSSPFHRSSTPGPGRPNRSQSTHFNMPTPDSPSLASFPSPAYPVASSPEEMSPARPIPMRSNASPSDSPYLSRSAPSSHSPPRGFWNTAFEDPLEKRKREEELRQNREADFERQRELARQVLEQQTRERQLAAERAAKKAALDAEIAAARRADEERQRRKAASRVAAERAAADRRRELAEADRRREEERRNREGDRARREELGRQRTRETWSQYEDQWRNLTQSASGLSFSSFPWPMELQPLCADDINRKDIEKFVLSPLHSVEKSARQRLREQMLRFHPDRFDGRWLSRVRECDRAAVQKAAGAVARELNVILSTLS